MHKWLLIASLAIMPDAISAQKHPPKPPVVTPPPIYSALNESYGDWSVKRYGPDGFMASTPNENGSALGVYCYAKGCGSFINPQITCDEDSKYPALVNSASAAFTSVLTCVHVDKRALLFFDDEKALVDAMSIGGNLGVAFPMQAGDFKVSRFSLTGALRAYARVAQLANVTPTAPSKGVGDSRL